MTPVKLYDFSGRSAYAATCTASKSARMWLPEKPSPPASVRFRKSGSQNQVFQRVGGASVYSAAPPLDGAAGVGVWWGSLLGFTL